MVKAVVTDFAAGVQAEASGVEGSLHPDSVNWVMRQGILSTIGATRSVRILGAAPPPDFWDTAVLHYSDLFQRLLVLTNHGNYQAYAGTINEVGAEVTITFHAFDDWDYPTRNSSTVGNATFAQAGAVSGIGPISEVYGEIVGPTRWAGSQMASYDKGLVKKEGKYLIGIGTQWLGNIEPGMYIQINQGAGRTYKVERVIDHQKLLLEQEPVENFIGNYVQRGYRCTPFGLALRGVGHANRRFFHDTETDTIHWSAPPLASEGGLQYVHQNAYLRVAPHCPGAITGMISYQNDLLIIKESSVHVLRGDIDTQGSDSMGHYVVDISTDHGSKQPSLSIGEKGVYWMDRMGRLVRWNGSTIQNLNVGVKFFDDQSGPYKVASVAGRVLVTPSIAAKTTTSNGRALPQLMYDEVHESFWRIETEAGLPVRAGNLEIARHASEADTFRLCDRSTEMNFDVDPFVSNDSESQTRILRLNPVAAPENPGVLVRPHSLYANVRYRASAGSLNHQDWQLGVSGKITTRAGDTPFALAPHDQKVVQHRIGDRLGLADYRKRYLHAMLVPAAQLIHPRDCLQLYALGYGYEETGHRSNHPSESTRR